MAQIKECIGKHIRISRGSITIKGEDGKTCGVVRDTTSLYDLQPNRQIGYFKKLRALDPDRRIPLRECIIKDDSMYVFRNIKSRIFHERYGYFSEKEKANAAALEKIYSTLEAGGIAVIECIFL